MADLINGTRFYHGSDNATWTEITNTKSLGTPGMPDVPDVDVTPLNGGSAFRTFKAGLATAGEMEFEIFFDKTQHAALAALYRTGHYWKVSVPDGSYVTFPGYLKKFGLAALDDADKPVFSAGTVKLTGAPTFTAAS